MADGTNGPTGADLERYLQQIDDADDELLALKSNHMNDCKAPRSQIREVLKTVKEAGVSLTAFRVILQKHRADRKVAARLAELEHDDRAEFDTLISSLGDFGSLPLGASAIERARADILG